MGTGLPNYEESQWGRASDDDDFENMGWFESIIFGIIWAFAFVLTFPADLIDGWKKRKSKKSKKLKGAR
jgi:hypothetical protein